MDTNGTNPACESCGTVTNSLTKLELEHDVLNVCQYCELWLPGIDFFSPAHPVLAGVAQMINRLERVMLTAVYNVEDTLPRRMK